MSLNRLFSYCLKKGFGPFHPGFNHQKDSYLGIADVHFDALAQLQSQFPDAVFLGVLSRFL